MTTPFPADLLDRASLGAAATTLLERWDTVDLVVHNARFIGPGHMDLITDTPVEVPETHCRATLLHRWRSTASCCPPC